MCKGLWTSHVCGTYDEVTMPTNADQNSLIFVNW